MALIQASEIYQWPVEKRERNQAGRPGKLHAKVAIVDDMALVSSANLTDDAWIHGATPTEIFNTISVGIPSKGMPAWKPQLGEEK